MRQKLLILLFILLFISCRTSKKITTIDRTTTTEHTISKDSVSILKKAQSLNKDLSFRLTLTSIDSSSSIAEKISEFERATGIKFSQDQVKDISKGNNVVVSSLEFNYNESSLDSTNLESSVNKKEETDTSIDEDFKSKEVEKSGTKLKTYLIYILLIALVILLIVIQIKSGKTKKILGRVISFIKKIWKNLGSYG